MAEELRSVYCYLDAFTSLIAAQESGGYTHEQPFQDYVWTLYVPTDDAFGSLPEEVRTCPQRGRSTSASRRSSGSSGLSPSALYGTESR
jgi:hypothetical protein